ncbi:MAG: cytochrome C, partial [Epsilonproteobacteria bacterium]
MKGQIISKLKLTIFATLLASTALFGAMHEKGSSDMKSVSGGDSCVKCHNGIEAIRDTDSDMMKQIIDLSKATTSDTGGCTVCHGGNPEDGTVKGSHMGAPATHAGGLATFIRDPGSIWIADKTCGICHADTVENTRKSLMATEAGKIQGNLHSWGSEPTKKV